MEKSKIIPLGDFDAQSPPAVPLHTPMRNLYKMQAENTHDTADSSEESLATAVTNRLAPLLNLYRQNIDIMLHPFGISAGQAPLLGLLLKQDGQFQKDLAQKLGVRASSLTTMVDRLERAQLLRRERSESDHRTCRVYLTERGRRISKKTQAVIRFINERNLAGFRGEEKLLILRLLDQMALNMQKQHYELLTIKDDALRIKRGSD